MSNITFFNHIDNTYGSLAAETARRWTQLAKKYKKTELHIAYLLKYRTFDMLPPHLNNINTNLKHIDFKSNKVRRQYLDNLNKFKKRLLNLEITDFHTHLRFLKKSLLELENNLQALIPCNILHQFYNTQMSRLSSYFDKCQCKKERKLENITNTMTANIRSINLGDNNTYNNNNYNNNNWLINLTEVQFPEEVIETISLGDNFNVENSFLTKRSKIEMVKSIEYNVFKMDADIREDIRQKITQKMNEHDKRKQNMKHIPYVKKQLLNKVKITKNFVKSNPNILFTKADKGNITVAIDKVEYIKKVEEMLSDRTTYLPTNRNPVNLIIKPLQKLLKRWYNNELIFETQYKNLYKTSGNIPRAYALPKVHKNNNSYRLIISSIGSPMHCFAKFLLQVLSTGLKEDNHSVKNSLEFVKDISKINIPHNYTMISLDVKSLFTNVPNALVKQSLRKRWPKIETICKIPWSEIEIAIDLIMNSTYFQFNYKYYKQIEGSPMGSPLSPFFAEIVMRDLEEHCLKDLEYILFYKRYVDDIFVILPSTKIDEVLSVFNGYHNKLQFTSEQEIDNALNFLDVNVIKSSDNKIITNWYRKSTFSGRTLNYLSNHPKNQKIAIIYNLVDRAIKLSHPQFRAKNIEIVKDILHRNNYPKSFVDGFIKKRMKFLHLMIENSEEEGRKSNQRKENIMIFPYITKLSDAIRTILRNYNIKVVFTINNKLNQIIKRGKDSLNKFDKHNVVYKIECKDCSYSYIGQTKRALQTRIKEHQNNIARPSEQQNVISNHRYLLHEMDWDNTTILDTEKHFYKRLVSEMLYIKTTKNTLNLNTDTEKLNDIYNIINFD